MAASDLWSVSNRNIGGWSIEELELDAIIPLYDPNQDLNPPTTIPFVLINKAGAALVQISTAKLVDYDDINGYGDEWKSVITDFRWVRACEWHTGGSWSYFVSYTNRFISPYAPQLKEDMVPLNPSCGQVTWICGMQEEHSHCEVCMGSRYVDQFVMADGEVRSYCSDCQNGLHQCLSCNDWIDSQNDDCTFSTYHDGYYCDECVQSGNVYITDCNHCGNYDVEEAFVWDDDEEAYYCHSCSHRMGMSLVKNYSYKPDPIFHAGYQEKWAYAVQKPMIGMEIEVEFTTGTTTEWATLLRDENPDQWRQFFYLKQDSSLSGACFEIVTHPFTFNYLKETDALRFLKTLPENRIDRSGSAGTHVHISKAAFTPAHLWKFLRFHRDASVFLGTVGGRGDRANYGTFANLKQELKNARKLMETAKAKNERSAYLGRGAINLANSQTIELRYPRACYGYNDANATAELAFAIYEFTNLVSVTQVRAGALTDPGFALGWFQDNAERYPYLAERLQTAFPIPKRLES